MCLHILLVDYQLIIIEACLAIVIISLYLVLKDTHHILPSKMLNKVFSQWQVPGLCLVWGLAAWKFPYLWLYTPLLFVEIKLGHKQILSLISGAFICISFALNPVIAIMICLMSFITYIINQEINLFQAKEHHSTRKIDQLTQLNERIKTELVRLSQIQDQQRQASILNERKRITHEIHDIIGHQLSSVIIQLNALELTSQEPHIQVKLSHIQDVLNTAMTNIRKVIHTQRDSAIDIENELKEIANDFTQCPINFEYQVMTSMPVFVQHSLIQIIKEGLTNIHKHSNATFVNLSIKEVQHQWILLLYDNGDQGAYSLKQSGIGLLSMEERVRQMDGNLFIHQDNGFRIYITIPIKEGGTDK